MTRFSALVLALVAMVGLVACGDDKKEVPEKEVFSNWRFGNGKDGGPSLNLTGGQFDRTMPFERTHDGNIKLVVNPVDDHNGLQPNPHPFRDGNSPGFSGGGMPNQGFPGQGGAPQGMPNQGFPGQNQGGFPQGGFPQGQGGMPQNMGLGNGFPQGGMPNMGGGQPSSNMPGIRAEKKKEDVKIEASKGLIHVVQLGPESGMIYVQESNLTMDIQYTKKRGSLTLCYPRRLSPAQQAPCEDLF